MIYNVETEEKERLVTFITDADPEFVSLVRHGANRTPFKVVRKEEEAIDKSMMFVQSILVPKNLKFEEVVAEDRLQWLAEAIVDKCEEFDTYNKFHQKSEDKFEKGSLAIVKLDDTKNVYAMAGKLVDKSEENSAITLGVKEVQKMSVPQTPADLAVTTVKPKPYNISFREMFDVELDSFLSVVRGTLNQTSMEATKRKKTVMSAIDGFKNFLNVGLDAISGTAEGKKKSDDLQELDIRIGEIQEAINQMRRGDKMPEIKKEDIVSIVEELFVKRDAEIAKKQEDDAKKADEVAKKAEEDAKKSDTDPDPIKALSEKIDSINTAVAGVTKKQEEFESQMSTTSAANEPVGDKDKTNIPKEKSVFCGLLTE